MEVDLKVPVGIVNYKGRQCYNIRLREILFWVNVYLGKDIANVYLDEVAQPLIFLGEVNTFWISNGRHRTQVLYRNQVELDPQPRFRVLIFGCFAKVFLRKFRGSPTKAVAKEKVSMEARSPTQHLCSVKEPGKQWNSVVPGGIFPT